MSLTSNIRADGARFVELTGWLVGHETPTRDVARCAALAGELMSWARDLGAVVEMRDVPGRGPHVAARWGADHGVSTLVLMHYDTVWPVGTLADRPFQHRDGVLTGPGTLDMKGGIAVFQLAMEHVVAGQRSLAGPVTALFTSDEEDGSETSRSWIEAEARAHDRTFCLEPGADPFSLRMERKGVGRYIARFTGVASHAGNAPEQGASAVLEASRFALATAGLNDPAAGISCVVGVFSGGTVVNVVPERAELEIDVRVWTEAQAAHIDAALRSFEPRDPRVSFELVGGMNRPPLQQSGPADALFTQAVVVAAGIGRVLGRAAVGGGSDGSFAAAVGCPTLDGLGASGDGPHTIGEHVRVTDSLDKAAIVAALLTES